MVTLDLARYTCSFGNKRFDLLHGSYMVNSSVLNDNLYRIDLDMTFANSINMVNRNKRSRANKNYSIL